MANLQSRWAAGDQQVPGLGGAVLILLSGLSLVRIVYYLFLRGASGRVAVVTLRIVAIRDCSPARCSTCFTPPTRLRG